MRVKEWNRYEELKKLVESIIWALCGSILRYSIKPIEPITYGVIIEATQNIRELGFDATQLYMEYVRECESKGCKPQSREEVLRELGYDQIPMLDEALDSEYIR